MELSCRHMPLPAETSMGPVHLTVSDLHRSLDYYRSVVGLDMLEQGAGRASLGADSTELLGLVEEADAEPSDGYTGLYHFALLVPDRPSLARWLAHAVRERVPLTGLSDHYVSEAIYLRDPDRHGIEIYADRPRELWEGRVGQRMTTEPLDVADLLAQGDGDFDRLDREREDRGERRRQRGREDREARGEDERDEEREAPRDPEQTADEAGLGCDLRVVRLAGLERHVRA